MIKDNPPTLPDPSMRGGVWGFAREDAFSADQYRAGEAAAFARGVAAGQAEIDRLEKEAQLISSAFDKHRLNSRDEIHGYRKEIAELRAKLKALEEQKPVAHFAVEYDMLGRPINFEQVVSPHGMPLYLAAGAKHD